MPDRLALLEALFAHAPVRLAFWDDELRYRRVNAALAEMNGRTAEEHLGNTPLEMLGPELGPTVVALLGRVRDEGRPVVDVEVEDPGPEPRKYLASYYPVPGAEGELLGVAGVVRDVSAQTQLEEERVTLLRDALAARAQADAARVRAEAARAETEAARARTEFLAAAGARLAAVGTDYEATLREVEAVAVPAIADRCTFTLCAPGDRRPAEDAKVTLSPDARHIRVPLTAHGRTLGDLDLVMDESGRSYGEDDRQLAGILAARAGLAVENARLYAERTHIARTLQRSLLPPELPVIPGVEMAARYRAAGDENEVGGDFYDAFRGPAEDWTLLLGDVAGKGAEAAAVTSLTRHTLRALTLRDCGPLECLELLNTTLLNDATAGGRFCTVLYTRVRSRADGSVELTLATGGHLPPRIVHGDGTVERVELRGSIVGGLRTPHFTATDVVLAPGDVIVLFTDGVTELRGHDPGEGERLLDELLATCGGLDPAGLVETVEARAVAAQRGDPRDDIALIALRPVP